MLEGRVPELELEDQDHKQLPAWKLDPNESRWSTFMQRKLQEWYTWEFEILKTHTTRVIISFLIVAGAIAADLVGVSYDWNKGALLSATVAALIFVFLIFSWPSQTSPAKRSGRLVAPSAWTEEGRKWEEERF